MVGSLGCWAGITSGRRRRRRSALRSAFPPETGLGFRYGQHVVINVVRDEPSSTGHKCGQHAVSGQKCGQFRAGEVRDVVWRLLFRANL